MTSACMCRDRVTCDIMPLTLLEVPVEGVEPLSCLYFVNKIVSSFADTVSVAFTGVACLLTFDGHRVSFFSVTNFYRLISVWSHAKTMSMSVVSVVNER